MLRKGDLTQGGITTTLLQFTLPMLAGSLLQQCYNIADTLIVGQCIGSNALAAVGSAYTLMVFLISILLVCRWGAVRFSHCNTEPVTSPPCDVAFMFPSC